MEWGQLGLSAVTGGDDEDLEYVKTVGDGTIDIPRYPKGAPFEVSYSYDVDGVIHVEVKDVTTGKRLGEFELERPDNLNAAELAEPGDRVARIPTLWVPAFLCVDPAGGDRRRLDPAVVGTAVAPVEPAVRLGRRLRAPRRRRGPHEGLACQSGAHRLLAGLRVHGLASGPLAGSRSRAFAFPRRRAENTVIPSHFLIQTKEGCDVRVNHLLRGQKAVVSAEEWKGRARGWKEWRGFSCHESMRENNRREHFFRSIIGDTHALMPRFLLD